MKNEENKSKHYWDVTRNMSHAQAVEYNKNKDNGKSKKLQKRVR